MHRIISGATIIYLNGREYTLRTATPILRYRAELFKADFIADNLFSDLLSRDAAISYLINHKLLSASYEKDLLSYDKSIEKIKIDLFKNYNDPGMEKGLRRKLSDAKKLRENLSECVHSLDKYTLEGSAEIAKQEFILANSLYNSKNKKVKVKDRKTLDNIIIQAYKYSTSVEDLRELARTDPWRGYWTTKKSIFGNSVDKWTDEQRTLYAFSHMYDNIYRHPETPPDKVINDDDLLDGWQLVQREKYEQRKRESGEDDGLKGDSIEKFIMVRKPGEEELTPEELAARVKQVYDQNSVESKLVIQQRKAVLEKEGTVRESDLPDIKKDFQMKAVNLMRKHKSGK